MSFPRIQGRKSLVAAFYFSGKLLKGNGCSLEKVIPNGSIWHYCKKEKQIQNTAFQRVYLQSSVAAETLVEQALDAWENLSRNGC